jgi:hypothetical protein
MKKRLSFMLLVSAFMLVAGMKKGGQPLSPVDYGKEANWAALPWKKDSADRVPVTWLRDMQDSAKVDVFYIHPTTYLNGTAWNARLDDKALNIYTDNGPVKLQGSVFNGSCRIFAPRYRQAVLRSFFSESKESKAALDLAYSDVKKAFQYYMEHYNNGRPVIIAGHSQGARHAMLLLKEFFDNKPLREKLVAAYPVGMFFKVDTLKTIPPCTAPGQVGCFASWNTVRWGTELTEKQQKFQGSYCVNPVSWRADEEPAASGFHKGSVPITYDRIDPAFLSTQRHGSLLWAEAPPRAGYNILAEGDNYHVGDISLFWLDIRENVALQVKNYFEKH